MHCVCDDLRRENSLFVNFLSLFYFYHILTSVPFHYQFVWYPPLFTLGFLWYKTIVYIGLLLSSIFFPRVNLTMKKANSKHGKYGAISSNDHHWFPFFCLFLNLNITIYFSFEMFEITKRVIAHRENLICWRESKFVVISSQTSVLLPTEFFISYLFDGSR